ncbi:MAG: 30S ribosomal protein S16 [Candidatus Firestonebacteria bacterium]
MAVVIRLSRVGAKSKPKYRIVVADSRFPRDGRNIEILGSFNPFDKEKGLNVKMDKVSGWLKKGAVLSNTIKKLLKKAKISS